MNSNKIVCLFLVVVSVCSSNFAAEKVSTKEKDKKPPVHQRGWIGGEYKLARRHWSWFSSTETVVAFPKSLTNAQKAGILITALSTNTPAYISGLREGDLILELDHKKVTSLSDFRRKVDQTESGTSLAVGAYHSGELNEYDVKIGRETFRHQGIFGFILPPIVSEPNLRFNPGFSLIVLGFSWDTGKRIELGSAEQSFVHECSPKKFDPSNRHWRAWAALLFAEHDHQILSQDIVAR